MKSDREYRSMLMEVRKSEDPDKNDEMIVCGYASTFNQPYELYRDGNYIVTEQVDASAFDETDMSDVIMQYDHQGRVFARLSNGTLKIKPDELGLGIEANLGGTEIGRNLYEEIKGGYTNKMSFGFTVTGDAWEETKNEDGTTTLLRTIKRVGKLYDVSAVSLPANDQTSISARKLGDGVIAELEAERLRVQKDKEERAKLLLKLKLMEVE